LGGWVGGRREAKPVRTHRETRAGARPGKTAGRRTGGGKHGYPGGRVDFPPRTVQTPHRGRTGPGQRQATKPKTVSVFQNGPGWAGGPRARAFGTRRGSTPALRFPRDGKKKPWGPGPRQWTPRGCGRAATRGRKAGIVTSGEKEIKGGGDGDLGCFAPRRRGGTRPPPSRAPPGRGQVDGGGGVGPVQVAGRSSWVQNQPQPGGTLGRKPGGGRTQTRRGPEVREGPTGPGKSGRPRGGGRPKPPRATWSGGRGGSDSSGRDERARGLRLRGLQLVGGDNHRPVTGPPGKPNDLRGGGGTGAPAVRVDYTGLVRPRVPNLSGRDPGNGDVVSRRAPQPRQQGKTSPEVGAFRGGRARGRGGNNQRGTQGPFGLAMDGGPPRARGKGGRGPRSSGQAGRSVQTHEGMPKGGGTGTRDPSGQP